MNKTDTLELLVKLTMQNSHDIDEHLMTLYALTLSMKPAMIVELGVRTCRSTLPFLLGSKQTGSRLISVDINDIRPDFQFPEDWKKNWEFHKKDALEFLEKDLPLLRSCRNSIQQSHGDIIYIDDWHAGDHVAKELQLLSDVVTPKDLIILHDLMYGNTQPHYRSVENPKDKQWDNGGPYRAISELDLGQWEYMTIPRCHGLTLLRKKSDKIIRE